MQALQPIRFSYEEGGKKRRTVQACVECRRRKTKCDRVFPCTSCKAVGKQDSCAEYSRGTADTPLGYTLLSDFCLLAQRVRELESLVVHRGPIQQPDDQIWLQSGISPVISSGLYASTSQLPMEDLQDANSEQNGLSIAQQNQSLEQNGSLPQGEDDRSQASTEDLNQAAFILEDFTYNRMTNVQRGTKANDHIYGAPFNVASSLSSTHLRRLDTIAGFGSLPSDQNLTDYLVAKYVELDGWKNKTFSVPVFKQKARAIRAWTPTTMLNSEDLQLLALYSSILCIGLLVLEEESAREVGLLDLRPNLCSAWGEFSLQCLDAAQWTQYHNLSGLQTMVTLFPYLVNTSRMETAWVQLGTCAKIASSLGINRLRSELPPEATKEQIEKRFGTRWLNVQEREDARRTFYNLQEFDSIFVVERHFACSFYPRLNHTAFPSNIEDEDLTGLVMPAIVSGQHTTASWSLMRFKLIEPMQGMLVKYHEQGRLDYQAILEADKQLRQIWDDRPIFYRDDCDLSIFASDAVTLQQLDTERTTIQRAYLNRLLRLHRPFFPASIGNPKYLQTYETSTACATEYLDLKHPAKAANYWAVPNGIFVAVLTLLIVAKNLDAAAFQESAARIRKGIDAFSSFAVGNFAASAAVLQGILDRQILERSQQAQSGSQKRKRASTETDEPEAKRSEFTPLTTSHTSADDISFLTPDDAFAAFRHLDQFTYLPNTSFDVNTTSLQELLDSFDSEFQSYTSYT